MSWFKIAQQNYLATNFSINTRTIGKIDVAVLVPFGEFDKWQRFKKSPDIWNYQQTGDKESKEKMIDQEPTGTLKISHEFSDWMPEVETPKAESDDILEKMNEILKPLKNDRLFSFTCY